MSFDSRSGGREFDRLASGKTVPGRVVAAFAEPKLNPSRPRLLVLASTYPRWRDDPEPGFVHELARRMVDHFEVTALVPHAAGAARHEVLDGVVVTRYRYAPARLQTLVSNGGILGNLRHRPWKWLLVPGFLLSQAWSLGVLVRQLRPDVVHAHWLLPQGMLAVALALVSGRMPPIVVTSHGADLFALRATFFRVVRRWVARRVHRLTVVSRAMRQRIVADGIGAEKVSVEPMGVDLQDRFCPDPSQMRAEAELLFVGRLVEKKGLKVLLDALPAIAQLVPSVVLRVAGFGPEEAALRGQAKALGIAPRVEFIGPIPQQQLPGLYRRATLLVAPFVQAASGDQEGLGLVLVEALGCGCPVVVGDVPAVRDVLAESSAALVPPDDPAALASVVVRLLQNPAEREQLALEGRKTVLSRFDWQSVANSYRSILEDAVSNAAERNP